MDSEKSDAQLVVLCQKGDERAYRELLDRYQRPLFSLIFRMVQNREQAEDLAQESFVRAFRNLAKFDPERKFSNWLFKIAHNHTIDYLRKKDIQALSLDAPSRKGEGGEGGEGSPLLWQIESDTLGPDAETERGEMRSDIEKALASLRPEYREVVVLRHMEGLSYDEIAAMTGLPLGTVKTYIHRARAELKQLLSPSYSPESNNLPLAALKDG